MGAQERVKRYAVMFAGFFTIALGICLLTKSNTGTSAISVIPYTASLLLPQVTYGTWVALFNGLLVLMQPVLLKGRVNKVDICMQVLFCLSCGVFVDLWMFLLQALDPQAYALRLVTMFGGVVALAFGAYLTLCSHIGVGAGDGFARALCSVTGIKFSTCRVICDTTMMLVAVGLNLLFFHSLITVREGTVATAVLCGMFVGLFAAKLKNLEYAVLPQNRPQD